MDQIDWRKYVDINGDFALPTYLYRVINELMKHTLDMGTLLSNDRDKTRAYKEQVKKMFKRRWLEIAEALESFELIVPCGCSSSEFCRVCGGSRYLLNSALTPDEMREVAFVVSGGQDAEKIAERLQKGLEQVEHHASLSEM